MDLAEKLRYETEISNALADKFAAAFEAVRAEHAAVHAEHAAVRAVHAAVRARGKGGCGEEAEGG